jgi:hypothetical protein
VKLYLQAASQSVCESKAGGDRIEIVDVTV